jgi:predicted HTH domain antitoxin
MLEVGIAMDTVTVELRLPRDLVETLDISPERLDQKAIELIALELFREGKISAGKAAELIGQSKAQFIDLLNSRGVPYLDASPEELAEDVAIAQAARKNQP